MKMKWADVVDVLVGTGHLLFVFRREYTCSGYEFASVYSDSLFFPASSVGLFFCPCFDGSNGGGGEGEPTCVLLSATSLTVI